MRDEAKSSPLVRHLELGVELVHRRPFPEQLRAGLLAAADGHDLHRPVATQVTDRRHLEADHLGHSIGDELQDPVEVEVLVRVHLAHQGVQPPQAEQLSRTLLRQRAIPQLGRPATSGNDPGLTKPGGSRWGRHLTPPKVAQTGESGASSGTAHPADRVRWCLSGGRHAGRAPARSGPPGPRGRRRRARAAARRGSRRSAGGC